MLSGLHMVTCTYSAPGIWAIDWGRNWSMVEEWYARDLAEGQGVAVVAGAEVVEGVGRLSRSNVERVKVWKREYRRHRH